MVEKRLTGIQKTAYLLISLGADTCAKIFKMMENTEVEQLASEITKIPNLNPEATEPIIDEFHGKLSTKSVSAQGGLAYATTVLSKALGTENAMSAMDRIRENTNVLPFEDLLLSSNSNDTLIEMLRNEHPQTIALILSHIKEQRSAYILAALPQEIQTDVIIRIANMKTVSPEILSQLEDSLRERSQGSERVHTGGVKFAANILNRADIDVEKKILESITKHDPNLADKISNLMFTYDNIVFITNVGIQKLLQEIDENDLLMALKASTEKIRSKIYKNMSERRRQSIQDDLQTMPPVRLKDVQAAQGRILETAKEMIQSGMVEVIRDSVQETYV
ncbi:MAG: Flagellar motor switch protein FliG [Candidatus Poribacteria bacterium]|nr:Flagellar motor switch protein FliG [Candidatus Poribacteria bacterium]